MRAACFPLTRLARYASLRPFAGGEGGEGAEGGLRGWKDALRHLYLGKRIYTFWKYFRNAFARDAGLRIDHLLLSPSLKNRSIASIEIATRHVGDGVVEYVRRIKLWDKGKALEQLSKHLGLYRDQGRSEPALGPALSDLTDQELAQRLLEEWARLGPAIEREARRLRDS
jgi:hypothetical protein